jgi:pyruvate kinase
MIAVSFIQTAADVRQARELMARGGAADLPLVAKLERPQAIEHLDEILEISDAVMVARGDLGLEMPLERVPRAQKEITRQARRRGIPVIVATQVLESMTNEARPTRAEVNDAANAVDDGVDAIMLAGETAVGKYPARAVQTLESVIREAETIPAFDDRERHSMPTHDHAQALCEAACTLADLGDAHAIVAVTRGGSTARRLSTLRPKAPIIAATEREKTARRLALYWGVVPIRMDIGDNLDEASARIGTALVDRALVPPRATAVFVSISPDLTRGDANYLKIQRL